MPGWKDPKTISAYAGLIASAAALTVSISAFRKKPDDTDSHSMYKVLVEAVERLSDESEQNRADIYRIRKYMDEYTKAQNSIGMISAPPPSIEPPRPIVQVEPPKPVASIDKQMDAGLAPLAVASSSADYQPHNTKSKPEPPIKLEREWKAKK